MTVQPAAKTRHGLWITSPTAANALLRTGSEPAQKVRADYRHSSSSAMYRSAHRASSLSAGSSALPLSVSR